MGQVVGGKVSIETGGRESGGTNGTVGNGLGSTVQVGGKMGTVLCYGSVRKGNNVVIQEAKRKVLVV